MVLNQNYSNEKLKLNQNENYRRIYCKNRNKKIRRFVNKYNKYKVKYRSNFKFNSVPLTIKMVEKVSSLKCSWLVTKNNEMDKPKCEKKSLLKHNSIYWNISLIRFCVRCRVRIKCIKLKRNLNVFGLAQKMAFTFKTFYVNFLNMFTINHYCHVQVSSNQFLFENS